MGNLGGGVVPRNPDGQERSAASSQVLHQGLCCSSKGVLQTEFPLVSETSTGHVPSDEKVR